MAEKVTKVTGNSGAQPSRTATITYLIFCSLVILFSGYIIGNNVPIGSGLGSTRAIKAELDNRNAMVFGEMLEELKRLRVAVERLSQE